MVNYPKLKKTWIFDLDGTLVIHGGYLNSGKDDKLPGIDELFKDIPKDDMIIIITGRPQSDKELTIKNLKELNIRFDHIIFNAGKGARIIVNDTKPSGYKTAHCFGITRDAGINKDDLTFFMEL
jgi:phosphoglycolate phosphatase-like HAD superfamily hydrolase